MAKTTRYTGQTVLGLPVYDVAGNPPNVKWGLRQGQVDYIDPNNPSQVASLASDWIPFDTEPQAILPAPWPSKDGKLLPEVSVPIVGWLVRQQGVLAIILETGAISGELGDQSQPPARTVKAPPPGPVNSPWGWI